MTRVPSPAGLAEAGALAMLASAVAGAVGVVCIVLMYAAFAVGAQPPGLMFGWANDIAVLLQYLLAVPGVLAIGAALRVGSPRLALAGTVLALAGIAVIVVSQTLLVAGVLTFEQEIGPASLGFLIVGAWMVVAAIVGRRAGRRRQDPPRRSRPRSTWATRSGRIASVAGWERLPSRRSASSVQPTPRPSLSRRPGRPSGTCSRPRSRRCLLATVAGAEAPSTGCQR